MYLDICQGPYRDGQPFIFSWVNNLLDSTHHLDGRLCYSPHPPFCAYRTQASNNSLHQPFKNTSFFSVQWYAAVLECDVNAHFNRAKKIKIHEFSLSWTSSYLSLITVINMLFHLLIWYSSVTHRTLQTSTPRRIYWTIRTNYSMVLWVKMRLQ